MKNFTLMAFVCLFLINAQAQDTATISRTIFKLSPQHFTDNSLKAGIERFNKTWSTSLVLLVTAKLANEEDNFYVDGYNGLAGEFQFRKYVSPMKMITTKKGRATHQGIYGAAYLQGGSYSGDFRDRYTTYDPNTGMPVVQTTYDYHESIGNWGFGFTMGYQKTLWQVVFLDVFVGGGIQFSDRIWGGQPPPGGLIYHDNGITDPGYKGILPKIGLMIGIGL